MIERIEHLYELRVHELMSDFSDDLLRRHARRLAGRQPSAGALIREPAAENLVSLTRRTAMELAGVARVRDPTLVRHIYDLHVTSAYYDATEVAQLTREIMPRHAEEFANQFPAYRENPVEETRHALAALETEQHFAQRYTEFLQLIVYGVKSDSRRDAI